MTEFEYIDGDYHLLLNLGEIHGMTVEKFRLILRFMRHDPEKVEELHSKLLYLRDEAEAAMTAAAEKRVREYRPVNPNARGRDAAMARAHNTKLAKEDRRATAICTAYNRLIKIIEEEMNHE